MKRLAKLVLACVCFNASGIAHSASNQLQDSSIPVTSVFSTPPPEPPGPSTPNYIYIKKAPLGVILEWMGSKTGGTFQVERKTSSSNWTRLPSLLKSFTKSGNTWTQFIDKTSASMQAVQYRVRGCGIYSGCFQWSTSTSPITTSTYNRNTSDSNGNNIRDDAEAQAEFYYPVGTNNHIYLMHYAYYLQKLVNSTYGPSSDMYLDFKSMTEALICSENAVGIQEIQATILDSENAVRRYLSATDNYANSTYSTWKGPSSCSISTNSLPTFGLTSFEVSEQNKNIILNQIQAESVPAKKSSLNLDSEMSIANASFSGNFKYVIYVNGMLTSKPDADANRAYIDKLFADYGRPDINVSLSHNFSEGAVMDAIQSFKQYVSSPNAPEGWFQVMADMARYNAGLPTSVIPLSAITNYIARLDYSDYRENEDRNRLGTDIDNRRLQGPMVMLAHSQGNFFANEVWETLNLYNEGRAKNFIRIYGLGTPASYIPHNGYYYTNYGDSVINTIRNIGHIEPLPANINISSNDISGHSLIKTYLKEGANHTSTVISRILTYFDEMAPPKVGTCIDSTNNSSALRYYTPSTDGFKGNLTVVTNSYSIPNSYKILDQLNRVLLSISSRSGTFSTSFYYNADVNGRLQLTVGNNGTSGDYWFMSVKCP